MKKGLFILFLAQTTLAAGPRYMGPTPTVYRSSGSTRGLWTPIYQEIVNIYHDIQFPQISTATIQNETVTNSSITTLNVTGSATLPGIVGTTTNDNAAAGNVGQWPQATAAGVTGGATGVFTNCASISLTAGDWDVSGILEFTDNNNPTFTSDIVMALSAFSGNTTTDHVEADNIIEALVPNTTVTVNGMSIPSWRASLASTTIIYVKGQAFYSAGGPPKLFCRISARRMR